MYNISLFMQSLSLFQLFNEVLRVYASILVVMVTNNSSLICRVTLQVGVVWLTLEKKRWNNVIL